MEVRGRDSLSPESEAINEALNSTQWRPYLTSPLVACVQPAVFAAFGSVAFSLTCSADTV